MLFNSWAYAVFLPTVFIAYWNLKDQYRWILILIASYFFYMCSGPRYLFIILGLTIVSYCAAIQIERSEKKYRKKVLIFSIAICVGVLFFFKYFNFFSCSFNDLLRICGIHHDKILLNIVLPVGISFYTFQIMSYVIDVYKGDTSAEHHLGKYAAFISFFPQLVAGPIERSNNLLKQIKGERKFDYNLAIQGVKQMLWGYYKKLVIADTLSTYVQRIYTKPRDYEGFSLVLATVFFSIQIYCDFSGYSDIAIGTAKLFGVELMQNFDSPYFSTSVKEFWGRWHISLSTWFRDYIYIPLGGSRVKKLRHSLNLMITFLISGLWHGANWTFVVWGGLHGSALVFENIALKIRKSTDYRIIKVIRACFVFAFCSFAWIFFVADSIEDAFYIIRNSLNGVLNLGEYIHNGIVDLGLWRGMNVVISVCVFILALYDYISYNKKWSHVLNKIQWIFYTVIGLIIVFFSNKGVAAEFIYFQF